MATNKVVYGNNTLIDLTNDSVTPETLLEGETAHDRSGAKITGSLRNMGHTILSKLGTPMTARANLSFGNANVTDDETNDVTKVDIQNIEPITQEAYNQLTQAEKNAHPWFITNATSFGGVYLFQTVALMEAAVQAGTVPAGAVMMTGVDTPYVPEAKDVVYDNTESELEATNAQNAIDEIVAELLTKQNATDNSLSTSSKNVVGAINELYSKVDDDYCNLPSTSFTIQTFAICATGVGLNLIHLRKIPYNLLPREVISVQYYDGSNWINVNIDSGASMRHANPSEYNSLSAIIVNGVYWDTSFNEKTLLFRITLAAI